MNLIHDSLFVPSRATQGNPLGAIAPIWYHICSFVQREKWCPMGTTLSLADLWFDLLDGRQVMNGQKPTKLLVQGIHMDGESVWIQVARTEQPASRLLLHVGPHATVHDVLTALRETPSGRDRIEVSHAA